MWRRSGVDSLRKLEALELDAVVVGGVGRVRIDAGRLVAVRVQKRDEAAEWTAAEIEHACRRRGQAGANERPERSEPAFAELYRQILG
jgi:hypothetical protein